MRRGIDGETRSAKARSTSRLSLVAVSPGTERQFYAAPYTIYPGKWPAWTPPLPGAEADEFDRRKNPSLANTALARWVVLDGNVAVGRVAAFAPSEPKTAGYFGFFESRDDPAVARLLLQASEQWLSDCGRRRIYGPIAVNPRDDIGLLIDGFDRPGTLMTPYNPPYYAALLEQAGYRPTVYLRAYAWNPEVSDLRGLLPLDERLSAREDIRIRRVRLRALKREALLIADLINRSFSSAWGYTPITPAEARQLARRLRPILDPSLCLVAETSEGPCGTMLTLPDANWLARQLVGQPRLWAWIRATRLRRRIPWARCTALAVLPGRRASGAAIKLLAASHRALLRGGYEYAELSQVFDDNRPMRRLLERMGFPVVKRYAVFERVFQGPADP